MFSINDRTTINNALKRIEDTYRDIFDILKEYPEHKPCNGTDHTLPRIAGSALLTRLLDEHEEIISDPKRFNGVSIENIKRIFEEFGIKYESPF